MDSRLVKSNHDLLVEAIAKLDFGGQSIKRGVINKLPNEMLQAILCRVPTDHLILHRSISSKWKMVIEDICRDKKNLMIMNVWDKDCLSTLSTRLCNLQNELGSYQFSPTSFAEDLYDVQMGRSNILVSPSPSLSDLWPVIDSLENEFMGNDHDYTNQLLNTPELPECGDLLQQVVLSAGIPNMELISNQDTLPHLQKSQPTVPIPMEQASPFISAEMPLDFSSKKSTPQNQTVMEEQLAPVDLSKKAQSSPINLTASSLTPEKPLDLSSRSSSSPLWNDVWINPSTNEEMEPIPNDVVTQPISLSSTLNAVPIDHDNESNDSELGRIIATVRKPSAKSNQKRSNQRPISPTIDSDSDSDSDSDLDSDLDSDSDSDNDEALYLPSTSGRKKKTTRKATKPPSKTNGKPPNKARGKVTKAKARITPKSTKPKGSGQRKSTRIVPKNTNTRRNKNPKPQVPHVIATARTTYTAFKSLLLTHDPSHPLRDKTVAAVKSLHNKPVLENLDATLQKAVDKEKAAMMKALKAAQEARTEYLEAVRQAKAFQQNPPPPEVPEPQQPDQPVENDMDN